MTLILVVAMLLSKLGFFHEAVCYSTHALSIWTFDQIPPVYGKAD
jgi:hypothetical protein